MEDIEFDLNETERKAIVDFLGRVTVHDFNNGDEAGAVSKLFRALRDNVKGETTNVKTTS